MLNLPRNIYIMALAMSLGMSSISMMVLVSSLLAAQIASRPDLATLPMAVIVIGTALSTIPAALLMQNIGRKAGMMLGFCMSMAACLLAYFSALEGNFLWLVGSALLFGCNMAFMQQGRFAIIESANNEEQKAKGLSLGVLSGLISAFLGPQIGLWGKDLITSPYGYAGSFLLLALVNLLALLILSFFKNPPSPQETFSHSTRPLRVIVKQPIFLIAASSSAIAYGVMTLVMTATPIGMHELHHHSLQATKVVIQSHLVAMFLPSLITGMLLTRINNISLLMAGLTIYLLVSLVAFSGSSIPHYWWALILLGLGWNILFVTSTNLLPQSYRGDERFKVQATNDFLVFGFQALASFCAGWVLFNIGWHGIIWIAVLASSCLLIILLVYRLKSTASLLPEP